MSKKVCKKCKLIVEAEECPLCKKNQFSSNFQGTVVIIDPSKSEIARVMGLEAKGEYAIKVK